jgi:hypothetical protein
MVELYKKHEESKAKLMFRRGGISLAAGAILTIVVPQIMDAVWPYLRDGQYQPYRWAVVLAGVLNLPAVIYCAFSDLPETLPKSDQSLYCWAVGFVFNIPYYAVLIFGGWWALERLRSRKSRQIEIES